MDVYVWLACLLCVCVYVCVCRRWSVRIQGGVSLCSCAGGPRSKEMTSSPSAAAVVGVSSAVLIMTSGASVSVVGQSIRRTLDVICVAALLPRSPVGAALEVYVLNMRANGHA